MSYILPELSEIKKLRKELGVTQKQLALEIGISQP
ncbi:helix-turn-helix domain-containing protein, partial [Candidatus Micrarchaeota archaeon]|nr:helix-turn-helix domain-containing protein [Candidatus Micrarchaeota archaeon]